MGIPMLAGRESIPRRLGARFVMISAGRARQICPNENPLVKAA